MTRRSLFLLTILTFGFAFLYVPIFSMIVYSFNGSRLVTVWGGFSTKWYEALFQNKQVISALMLSLKIALVSSTLATILGTLAGIALVRFRAFRGRTLFSGLVTAPLEALLGQEPGAGGLFALVQRLVWRGGFGSHAGSSPGKIVAAP